MKAKAAGAAPVARSKLAATGVLLDTGVLVALYARDDPQHGRATRWLTACRAELHTVEAVLTEAAYFLPLRTWAALAALVADGTLRVHHPEPADYLRTALLLRKYADLDPDWADIQLLGLAETTGITRIATLDVADFSVYRINGRKRFELELLR